MKIPLIDFGTPENQELVAQIDSALSDVGFMTAVEVGVSPKTIERAFAVARDFFYQDEMSKQAFRYRSSEENFGYQGIGAESLEPGKPGDLKESFTMRIGASNPIADARWPSASFQDAVLSLYAECMSAAQLIMTFMARSLDLPDDFFSTKVGGENVALRILHYPGGQSPSAGSGELGAGAHTDYGILTLLFQQDVSGLEVKDAKGQWNPVPCQKDTIVVNTGDLMHRWTNGKFRSTEHRVKPMTGDQDRFSIAFFVDPDSATKVEVLPSCVDDTNPCRYPPITAGEHIQQKIKRSHT